MGLDCPVCAQDAIVDVKRLSIVKRWRFVFFQAPLNKGVGEVKGTLGVELRGWRSREVGAKVGVEVVDNISGRHGGWDQRRAGGIAGS